MTKDVFSVPVFLVVFRETLETVIIVSVLLAFLKQTLDGPNRDVTVYKRLVRQVRPPLRKLHSSTINQSICKMSAHGSTYVILIVSK